MSNMANSCGRNVAVCKVSHMSKKKFGESAAERLDWARRVRQLRQARGMTQSELAELAGTARQTISNMETEVTSAPQAGVLRRVLEVLGVDVDDTRYSDETELWLSMMGAMIEAIPAERRARSVDEAVRVLAGALRPSVGGSPDTEPTSDSEVIELLQERNHRRPSTQRIAALDQDQKGQPEQ